MSDRSQEPLNIKRIGSQALATLVTAILLVDCGAQPNSPAAPETQTPVAETSPTHIALSPGQEITLQGTVVENRLGCELDGACILRLVTADGEVTVVYHYGEFPPCPNEAAIRAGMDLQVGDSVEIHGQVDADGLLSTCSSSDYYIRGTE